MEITQLVIRFNYGKLITGLITALLLFYLAIYSSNEIVVNSTLIIGTLIILNIISSIIASYILYDRSDLFKLKKIPKSSSLEKFKKGILVHASFDPVSSRIEREYPNLELTVCDIYSNRHEHESAIRLSQKTFPPNSEEIKVDPTNLPFEDSSQQIIIGITSLHEILSHEKRVVFFKEAKRILVDGGIIIMSEQFRNLTNFLFFNIGAFHFISQRQWKKAIESAGLKIVENQQITPFANMLIIK